MNIIDVLKKTNNENRVDRKTLSRLTGLNDRDMREQIHDLRRAGHFIIGDTSPRGGYYIGNAFEWDQFCEQQRRRALSNFYTKSSERNIMPGQMRIV